MFEIPTEVPLQSGDLCNIFIRKIFSCLSTIIHDRIKTLIMMMNSYALFPPLSIPEEMFMPIYVLILCTWHHGFLRAVLQNITSKLSE